MMYFNIVFFFSMIFHTSFAMRRHSNDLPDACKLSVLMLLAALLFVENKMAFDCYKLYLSLISFHAW